MQDEKEGLGTSCMLVGAQWLATRAFAPGGYLSLASLPLLGSSSPLSSSEDSRSSLRVPLPRHSAGERRHRRVVPAPPPGQVAQRQGAREGGVQRGVGRVAALVGLDRQLRAGRDS